MGKITFDNEIKNILEMYEPIATVNTKFETDVNKITSTESNFGRCICPVATEIEALKSVLQAVADSKMANRYKSLILGVIPTMLHNAKYAGYLESYDSESYEEQVKFVAEERIKNHKNVSIPSTPTL